MRWSCRRQRRPAEVRGIFSLSQIARQLGMPLQLPSQAQSFAEIEAALS
jgi:hypothetical protein